MFLRMFRPFLSSLLFLAGLSLGLAQTPPSASSKIVLTPDMLVNESALGNVAALIDEQQEAGDPRAKKGGQPKTDWNKDIWEIAYPISAYIDLGGFYNLTDISLYDTNGEMTVKLESGTPSKWEPLLEQKLTEYLNWTTHPVKVRTRYVHIIIPVSGGGLPEIVLYGTPEGPITKATIPAPQPRILPTMENFIGTNAFVDDPIEKIAVGGYLREYHSWDWDALDSAKDAKPFPHNVFAFNPSRAGPNWDFDDFYTRCKAANIFVCPSLKASVSWLTPKLGDRPADPKMDPADPLAYRAHADHLFQFVARYGKTKVDDKKLKLAPDQKRLSGLDLIQYVENGNENDGWWAGPSAYSTPYQLAAQCSADYDGHKGQLGDTFGIKNADPNAKLVMSGLARPAVDYIRAMKAWADAHRGGDFPADVINIHTYSNEHGGQGNEMTIGISPEQDKLRERMHEFVDYRNRYLPKQEVWLTEFGYDTHPAAAQRAPAIGKTPPEEVQARWILRSYLAVAAAGFDRAAQYMLRDVSTTSTTKFDTSGLVGPKGDWTPKPSWYYTYTLKNRLTGMRYAGDVDSGNKKVWIYKFRSDDGRGAYVLWCPTADNSVVKSYALKNLGAAKTATLVEFVDKEKEGKASPLTLTKGSVTVNVSECPVIVLVDVMGK
jgi:hypothetical protein